MKKMILKWMISAATVGSLVLLSGCNGNKSSADYDSIDGTDIYGDPIDGGFGLNSTDGLPVDGDRSVVDPVYFAYDSTQVSAAEATKCEEVAGLLSKSKWKGVIVEGHGDERGSREYNLALGERRALAVRDYLISLGVDPSVIQTKSFGEESPDDMGHDENAYSKNRRGVFAMY